MLKRLLNIEDDAGVLEMCRKCYGFRQENGAEFEKAEYFLESEMDEKIVRFIECHACAEEAFTMFDLEYV